MTLSLCGDRVGQHRHRPDGQAAALARRWSCGPWSASTRTPRAWPGPASWGSRRPPRGSTGLEAHGGEIDLVFEATSARVHARQRAPAGRGRHHRHRPDPGPARAAGRAQRQPDRAPRRPQREPDHLRRPGHDPDRGRGGLGQPGAVRRDRLHGRLPLGRARAPARTSTSSPRPPPAAWRRSAGPPHGKAIIVLNPADPPILMRNTVFCALPDGYDEADGGRRRSTTWSSEVARYVPGYRLKRPPVFDEGPFATPGGPAAARVVALLEVEGAGDFLPAVRRQPRHHDRRRRPGRRGPGRGARGRGGGGRDRAPRSG